MSMPTSHIGNHGTPDKSILLADTADESGGLQTTGFVWSLQRITVTDKAVVIMS